MFMPRICSFARTVAVVAVVPIALSAADLRITLPKRSKPTPVQKLNIDGVKAVKKNDIDKAKRLFYEAYLLDPNDPFTLNNLGYIAELEGDAEKALRFYELAGEMKSDAVVARASAERAEGRPVTEVAGAAEEKTMQVNRLNVTAIGLLLRDRAPEADVTLQKALEIDPNHPFSLNNMGFAKEKQGELEAALHFYTRAAKTGSEEKIVVSPHRHWRGKAISEIAEENADAVRRALKRDRDIEARVARLNLQGVSALNRNERDTARQYFEQARKLDPNDSFTLNNMGYMAEIDGDRETANFYYEKAKEAERADTTVGVATRREVEGREIGSVAAQSDNLVEMRMAAERELRRRRGEPIQLKRRDGAPVSHSPSEDPGGAGQQQESQSDSNPRDTVEGVPLVSTPAADQPSQAPPHR